MLRSQYGQRPVFIVIYDSAKTRANVMSMCTERLQVTVGISQCSLVPRNYNDDMQEFLYTLCLAVLT